MRKTEPPAHLNTRPSWDCLVCGKPWPCVTARTRMLVEYREFPSTLTVYMSAQMYDALNDFVAAGQLAPTDLFDRFLAWGRRGLNSPDE
ncbi:hypothetical protein KOI35_01615 [Actinoplanes bogorensis]|uniref:Flavin reductase n=2 Tax=Paractinoplanes bogorensis TaxID=1610840 RepID=A0ABS5YGS8_9ACTN|nr:hypothetical protein [Actinoplanes bogorensis]